MRTPYAPYCAKVFGDSEDLYKYAPYFGMGMGGYGGGGYGGGFGMPRSPDQCRAFMQRNGFRYQRGVATDSDSAGFKRMANMFQMCQRMAYRQTPMQGGPGGSTSRGGSGDGGTSQVISDPSSSGGSE